MWAVFSLQQLKDEGYQLSPKQLEAIRKLRQNKLKIETCSGCVYFERSIAELMSEYSL